MIKKICIFLFCCINALTFYAQRTDTVSVYSPSMKKEIRNVVIFPDGYDSGNKYPVLYLLHGYGGNHKTWLNIKPELPVLASAHGMIIVCPDGAKSWYWDSPKDSALRYETYVSSELIDYIDMHYKTRADRSGRAVTGLSMGGQGALWLGIRHQDVFGACGSTSGGVDIRPFPDSWDMKKSLGEYRDNIEIWDRHTISSILPLVCNGLPIYIDCGTDDFFYNVNEQLHKDMLYRNIKHEYVTRPGRHNASYWNFSIEFQMLFFSNYFKGKEVYR